MPRILINEIDKTSPGTPAQYENYSVLIAGYRRPADDTFTPSEEVKADNNGVYEFTKADDFASVIGLYGPRYESEAADGADVYHYGNQMAYELLKIGYPVIYLPIDNVTQLFDETNNIWEIFKDKANYDFRFVTHGLLESTTDALTNAACVRKALLNGEVTDQLNKLVAAGEAAYAKHADEEGAIRTDYINIEINNTRVRPGERPTWLPLPTDPDVIAAGFNYNSYENIMASIKTELEILERKTSNLDGFITTQNINTANLHIADLANYVAGTNDTPDLPGRGDCTALIELDEKVYVEGQGGFGCPRPENLIIEGIKDMSSITANNRGRFCAMTVPSVYYNGFEEGHDKFPGAFHYLACFKQSLDLGFAEWYAAAGYTRGVSSYSIKKTRVALGEIAINALEPRYIKSQETDPTFACNVIANFRGSYYLWGNRTCHKLQEGGNGKAGDLVASHFLNIRQLCSTIKKQLYVACRRFTFDPNSDVLWINFCNAITPTLDKMKSDQGIKAYKIIKVFTDKKATLKARIRIIPIEAVEDFDLEISLEDSFGETTAVVAE